MTPRLWRTALFVTMVVGLALALRPLSSNYAPEKWFLHSDKLFHVAYFAVLWLLAWRAGLGAGWALALALIGFGVGIEVAQALAPTHRSASASDVAADACGIALAWAFTRRRVRQPQENRG